MARKKPTVQSEDDAYLDELKRMFARSQDLCEPARLDWQIDQDYYDGKQWTQEEIAALAKRKQPALVFNHIKPAVNAVIGIVERGKTDPKAYGRTPKDADSADVATDCLRYIADINRFQQIRSAALKDMLIQGVCVATVEIQPDKEVKVVKGRPEAFFYDPYSREPDFSDARYVGLANWMDEQDVIGLYQDKAKEIEEAVNANGLAANQTFLDRPKDSWAWADAKSRRLMVIEMHHKKRGEWHKTVFVSGVILETGLSPYKDAKGRPTCSLIAMSAYVDRDNRRYGIVRDMRGPQDAINKGRSKAVHLLSVAKLRVDPGLLDVDQVRAEYAKPDGIIEAREGQIEQLQGQELLPAHIEMLRDAKSEMQRQSPTPGIVGRNASGQSGRAILAEQQAGLTEMSPILGRFDDWTLRIYRACWACVKQFWDAPQYIRVTDDEDAPRFIMFNEPALMMDPNNPGHPVIGPDGQPVQDPNVPPRNSPAQMDVDIIIDSSPDVANLAEEQFQKLAELVQAGIPIPPDALIEASALPRKKQILDKMQKAQEQQQGQPNPMQIEEQKAQLQLQTKQQQAQIDAEAHAQELQRQDEADARKAARAEALEQQKFNNAMRLLQAQQETEAYKAEQTVAVDTRKQQAAVETERAKKLLDLEHQNQQHEMAFHFETKKQQQVVETEREKGKAMGEAQAPAIDALHEKLDKVGEALKQLAKPKRIVRDPVTGEKRAEYVN